MRSRINAGLFQKVFITNDGSTDDTFDGIERFKKENNYRNSVFRILNHWENAGKMQRFFEAFEDCETDIFVMTDGDMVSAWWDTFSLLSNPTDNTSMIVSPVFEASGCVYQYWGEGSSWTRWIYREAARRVFVEEGISVDNIPGQGYGLEVALNYYLRNQTNLLKWTGEDNVPKFLESFRKDRVIQRTDKDRTWERIEVINKHNLMERLKNVKRNALQINNK
jgi:hypothetical protein